MIALLAWLLVSIGYIIGEVIAAFTAVLLPQTLRDSQGRFAWHLASLRVLLWWLVLLIGFFYALSISVRIVHQRLAMKPAASWDKSRTDRVAS